MTLSLLTKKINKDTLSDEEYQQKVDQLNDGLSFSPFTGQIAALGLIDAQTNKGTVYYQSLKQGDIEKDKNITYEVVSERGMLENFWRLAASYQEFVGFNSRCFDVPFIMIRSAYYRIRPTKNLLFSRSLAEQPSDSRHIDLYDQLSFYGAMGTKSLHLCCRLFGIESPKLLGVSGHNVAELYKSERFLDIARYNAADIVATARLYDHWNSYLNLM